MSGNRTNRYARPAQPRAFEAPSAAVVQQVDQGGYVGLVAAPIELPPLPTVHDRISRGDEVFIVQRVALQADEGWKITVLGPHGTVTLNREQLGEYSR